VLDSLVNFLVHYVGQYGVWGVLIGMTLESACIPLPSEAILPFGGFLAAQGKLSLAAAMLAGVAGGMLGSVLSYYLGVWLGRELILKYGRYVLVRRHEFDLAEGWFQRHGEWAVFVARLLPGVRTFISLPAGMARMHFGRFFGYSLAGSVPWTIVLVYVGYKLGEHWEALRPWMHRFDLAIIVALVAAVAAFLWWRLRERQPGET